MWFCSSGSGPGPSVGVAPLITVNGLDTVIINAKKNAATT